VAFRPRSTRVTEVASGSPLLVDVEFGRGHQLYALSQGVSVAVAHRRLGPNSSATTSTVERALPCAHAWVR
jgi:hypothetical protein